MSGFKEFDRFDGLGLAELVRKKEVAPSELYEETIRRIEQVNPKINAVILTMYDLAREAVQKGLPEGLFTGVPFLLKDMTEEYAGVPMTRGSRVCKNYVPTQDSEMVQRFKKSGVVILGKTNLPEFGVMGITEPELYGPTRNPWNTGHTPGGSSGGSAAAVAAVWFLWLQQTTEGDRSVFPHPVADSLVSNQRGAALRSAPRWDRYGKELPYRM